MSRNYFVANKNNNDVDFMDPFFGDLFTIPFMHESKRIHKVMKTDVLDEGDHYLLKIDVPSIKRENIQIHLEEGKLTISVNENEENEKKDEKNNYISRERYMGSYSRSFYVGEDVTEEDINAKLENGTLEVTVKKVEEKKPVKKLINIA